VKRICAILAAALTSIVFTAGVTVLGIRDSNRRWQEGYEAGRQNIPVEACPYAGMDGETWRKGWIRGKVDR